MSRFYLSTQADADLAEILEYLNRLPDAYANRISGSLEAMLFAIGRQPYLGSPHSKFTCLLAEEVRSRIVAPYRIFYRMTGEVTEIFALLHTARNIGEILAERLH